MDFENFSNSLIYTNSVHNGPPTGLISGDHAYYFGLFAAFTNQTIVDATLSGWSFEGYATNTTIAGLINGNNLVSDAAYGPLIGWGSGETANFLVVGWSANIGTTWGAASAWWNNGNPNSGPSGYFAISGIAQDVVVGGSVFPIPTIFGPTPGYEIQGFTLNFYDLTTPYPFAITSIKRNGNDVNLVWNGLAGNNLVQVSTGGPGGGYTNSFSTLATIFMPFQGVTNYTDSGGATNLPARYYRIAR